jgi:hypothetical protein
VKLLSDHDELIGTEEVRVVTQVVDVRIFREVWVARHGIGIGDELAVARVALFAGRRFPLRYSREVLCNVVPNLPFVILTSNDQAKAWLTTKTRWLDATTMEVLGDT